MEAPIQKPKLRWPPGGSSPPENKNLVIIGANGSGKSRLGAWLEQKHANSHRVSAQRALKFQDSVPMKSLDDAEKLLRFGNAKHTSKKIDFRWGGTPTNFVLNNFDHLLATLFARQRERDHEHSRRCQELSKEQRVINSGEIARPASELDRILEIWCEIYPHRKLLATSDKLQGQVPPSEAIYAGSEMSDGERVAIYLMGQVLCAPRQAVVILDEPEIHIHRSVLAPLFDRLEVLREDCLFIYISHDPEFAATRTNATKLWQREFHGGDRWTWELVDSSGELPEPLLLTLLGNRKPVLFVEGEKGSIDEALFSALYPGHLVVPCGGCGKVIESTKAYHSNRQLTHVKASGIVDRDWRSEAIVEALKARGVSVLKVAEVENLLLAKSIVLFVAEHLKLPDPERVFREVENFVYAALTDEVDVQAYEHAVARLQDELDSFPTHGKSREGLINAVHQKLAAIDAGLLFDAAKEQLERAIADQDYDGVLRRYNRKSLATRVGGKLGLDSKGGYPKLVLGIAQSPDRDGESMRSLLSSELPELC